MITQKQLLFITCLFFFINQSLAQLCNGSLSDPIISIDFGSGSNTYGPPLSAGQTTYQYLATNNVQDGQYTITTSPSNALSVFHDSPDHTPDDTNGYMFVVNADFTPGEFYKRRVTGLCENTIFEFSTWVMNILKPTDCGGNGIDPNVRFEIRATNGSLIASSQTGNIPETSSPTWRNFGITFDIGANTEVDVIMINNAPGGCGNDLAIDDIEFRACGDNADITTNIGPINGFCSFDVPAQIELSAQLSGDVYSNPFYQWETSTDGNNWSEISGQTNVNFTISPVVDNTFYRFRAAGSSANITNEFCSVLSSVIEINIFPEHTWQIEGVTDLCDDEGLSLSISGSGNAQQIVWELPDLQTVTATTLNLPTGGFEVGNYKATITDENNCVWTKEVSITLSETATTNLSLSGCEGQDITLVNNETYTITQTEQITRVVPRLLNSCDSTINYSITAFQTFNQTIDSLVCYESFVTSPENNPLQLIRDTTLNYTFLSLENCDSLVTKRITVPQPVSLFERVCENDILMLPDGSSVTATTSFDQQFRIPSLQNSCDSIINFTVNVGIETEETNAITVCPFQLFTLPNEEQTEITEEGNYQFSYVSQNGCDSLVNYMVTYDINECSYEDLCKVTFPTAISPNNDGMNDTFKPLFAPYCNYSAYELLIFNRWGEKVFSTTNTADSWQPTIETARSVFLWYIEYTLVLEDGTEQINKDSGTVSLLP